VLHARGINCREASNCCWASESGCQEPDCRYERKHVLHAEAFLVRNWASLEGREEEGGETDNTEATDGNKKSVSLR